MCGVDQRPSTAREHRTVSGSLEAPMGGTGTKMTQMSQWRREVTYTAIKEVFIVRSSARELFDP